MKIRLFMTCVVILLNRFTLFTYDMIKSPVTGAANAQQMNDTIGGYATSRFFALNGIESVIFFGTLLALFCVWGSLLCKSKKSCLPNADKCCNH